MKIQTVALLLIGFCLFFSSCKKYYKPQPAGEDDEMPGYTDFAGSAKFLFDKMKNPATGRVPPGIRELEVAQARGIREKQLRSNQLQTNNNYYSFQGPENLGGRTRAVVYDMRYDGTSNRTIMAGGVSGGIFKSIDDGATWIRKGPTDEVYTVTCIAQDSRPGFQDTWYYGTGESFGSHPFFMGDGVFKSTDNGETWSKLVNSNTGFLELADQQTDCIWRIAVAANGDVYIAAIDGIFRSTDGGNNWARVLGPPSPGLSVVNSTDIIITPSQQFYAAFSGHSDDDFDGVWMSNTGNPGTWTRIAGEGSGGSPQGWNADLEYGRIVLAVAPSNEYIVYAYIQSNVVGDCQGVTAELFRWYFPTATWTDLSANLPGCQGFYTPIKTQSGYDMVIAVRPDNPYFVIIGGIFLYRSVDGFQSVHWTTEFNDVINNSYEIHVDMHSISFQPGNPSVMICGNDGGIFRTTDNTAANVDWTPLNTGFRTYQYYYVTLDPRTGYNKVMGGAQDNGTTRNINPSGSSFEEIFPGDGGQVGLSNNINGVYYEYVSYQLGNLFRRDAEWSSGGGLPIRPIFPNPPPVLFISPYLLDPDNTEFLYYVQGHRIFRTSSASTVTQNNWTELSGVSTTVGQDTLPTITALATTRGNYDPGANSLYISDASGNVYRLDDPINANPATIPIKIFDHPEFFPTISSISVNPRNDDTVLLTVSSYGNQAIWWTGNAKSSNPTWINVERNLTIPSVWSSAIAITPTGVEYFVGTTVGLFKSTDPLSNDWTQEGATEIGNALVSSLFLRPSDNRLLVGTYGYGMWATTLGLECAVNTWTGAVSTQWENAANWSCGIIPNENSHVIIPVTLYQPVVNSNVTLKTIRVYPYATLSVGPGYNLVIKGPL